MEAVHQVAMGAMNLQHLKAGLDGAHGGRDKRILDLADLSEAQLMAQLPAFAMT